VLAFALAGGSGKNVARGASVGPTPGIGLVRLGGGSGTSENWSTLTNTDKYSVIATAAADAPQAAQLPGRSLLHVCAVNIASATWSSTCGVGWTSAVANNWLLKDAYGNYVGYGDGVTYLTDIGNAAYQQAFVSAVDSILRGYPGIDGVMIDNIVGHLITPSVKYPDSASYRAAMKSFVDAVGPALRAKGWYVGVSANMTDTTTPNWWTLFGNQCDGSQLLWWIQQLAPDVDAFMNEYWQMSWTDGSARLSGTASCNGQNWDGWQRIVPAVEGLGKDFIPVTSGTSDAAGVAKSTYLKASFMLEYDGGRSAFMYSAGGSGNWTTTVDDWMGGAPWTLDLGNPSGSKYQVGVGWQRNFVGGTVVVNPSPSSSQTFALGATYLMPDGSSTTSVTLSPGSALILQTATSPTTTTTDTTPTTTTSTTTTSATTTTTSTTTTTTPVALPPSNATPPTTSGPQLVGKTLTASQGSWTNSPTSYAYQWFRCDATGANCVPLDGATSATYTVVAGDAGQTLIVSVIASNAAGSASASSAPTAIIKTTGKK
jgi:hypothetical protein